MSDDKDNQLTVLVLATTFPRWGDDTVPEFVKNLSVELRDKGMNIVVLAPHHPGAKKHEFMSGMEIYRCTYFLPERLQTLCYQSSILESVKSSYLALIQVPLLAFSLLIHTVWILSKKDIDVIHTHWALPNGFIGSLMNLVFKVPHIMTLHAGGVRGMQNLPFKRALSRFLYTHTSKILPVSTHIKDQFEKNIANGMNTQKFEIQPMGAYVDDFSSRDKDDLDKGEYYRDVRGLYVGRLTETKGLYYLLDSLETLRDQEMGIKMIIVGTGSLENELKEIVNQKGLNDYVEFTGWLTGSDLRYQYSNADFLVLPSLEMESGVSEGMPTVIVEAFASATPVIASKVGGIPDVIEHNENGFLVKQRSAAELARSIQIITSNKDLRKRLARGATKTAEKLDWSHCGETYTRIIQEVTDTSNNPEPENYK